MRRLVASIALVFSLAGCGGDPPTRPYTDTVDRARDVAEQLDTRSQELEQHLDD